MATREEMLAFAEDWKRLNPECFTPYYTVYLIEKRNEKILYNFPGRNEPVSYPFRQ